MAHAVPHVDDLVQEYLLFRGFTSTLRVWEHERKHDRTKAFSVDKIIGHLNTLVSSHDMDGLVEFWEFLRSSFFVRLEPRHLATVDALETALLRYFLIYAIESDRRDVVAAFFAAHGDRLFATATDIGSGRRRGNLAPGIAPLSDTGAAAAGGVGGPGSEPGLGMGAGAGVGAAGGAALGGDGQALPPPPELCIGVVGVESTGPGEVMYTGSGGSDWLEWFALPVLAAPDKHPTFRPYFSKAWVDSFVVSLSNFLRTVFHALPLPKILAFNQARLKRRALEAQVRALQAEVSRLRSQLTDATREIADRDKKSQVASALRVQRMEAITANRPDGARPRVSSTDSRTGLFASVGAGSSSDNVVGTGPRPEDGAAPGTVSASEEDIPAEVGVEEPFIVLNQEVFAEHTKDITRCQFSIDGSSIASASLDGTVRLWTFSSFPSTRNAVISCGAPVLSLEWEQNSDRLLLCGTADREIKIWSVNEKKELYSLLVPAHVPAVRTLACAPSSQMFVAGLSGRKSTGELRAWDLRTVQETMELPLSPAPTAHASIAFNHNGRLLVAGGADGMIRVFDMTTGSPIMGWPAHDGAVGGVTGVAFTNDENSVVSHGADGKFTRWSLHQMGTELYMYNTEGLAGHVGGLSGLAMDGDGSHMIIGTAAGQGAIYQLEQHGPVQMLGGHTGHVTSVDWHPTLNCAITGSADASVRVSKLLKAIS